MLIVMLLAITTAIYQFYKYFSRTIQIWLVVLNRVFTKSCGDKQENPILNTINRINFQIYKNFSGVLSYPPLLFLCALRRKKV